MRPELEEGLTIEKGLACNKDHYNVIVSLSRKEHARQKSPCPVMSSAATQSNLATPKPRPLNNDPPHDDDDPPYDDNEMPCDDDDSEDNGDRKSDGKWLPDSQDTFFVNFDENEFASQQVAATGASLAPGILQDPMNTAPPLATTDASMGPSTQKSTIPSMPLTTPKPTALFSAVTVFLTTPKTTSCFHDDNVKRPVKHKLATIVGESAKSRAKRQRQFRKEQLSPAKLRQFKDRNNETLAKHRKRKKQCLMASAVRTGSVV
jgi:hypothetical protein